MKKYILFFAIPALFIACQSTSSKKDSQVMPSSDMALIDTTGLKNFKIISNEWINDSAGIIQTLTYRYTTDTENDTVVTVTLPDKGKWVNKWNN